MNSNKLKIWTIFFNNEISPEEISAFRGAIIANSGSESLLFHNHDTDERFRYRYPLIQYKRIHRNAAIVCVGVGVDAFGAFFANCNFDVRIGSRSVTLQVEQTNAYQHLVQLWDTMFAYRIRKWLPLNQENYAKYMALESLAEKYAMLEKMLTGNILSFAKGIGIHFEQQVECKITAMDEPRLISFKDVKMMAFDAEFKSNVSLPDYIGLGKGVSLGMGTVVRKYDAVVPKKIFLLGGCDLEMETIKEIAKKQSDCKVIDYGLAWDNAALSAYRDALGRYAQSEIYAVELQEDMETPANFHRIDHHNDMNGLPSSLEQVAALLGIELNRYQKLVAANDSGYIPAMKALQATDEEIAEIRLRDRAAQGVTEEEERLAQESVANNFQKGKRLWVVKSLTSKFSPICDRLFPYQSLLIYTDHEWMFYGEGKSELATRFSEEISHNKVFHGGGEKGFVGCVKGVFTKEEIENFVEQIKQKYDA